MAVGFITAIVWRETLHDYMYELVPAFLLAFITVWIISLAYPEKEWQRVSDESLTLPP